MHRLLITLAGLIALAACTTGPIPVGSAQTAAAPAELRDRQSDDQSQGMSTPGLGVSAIAPDAVTGGRGF